ncbi:5-formyltetrahydrofolate cyclo-ligase [Leptidea sinapis]|uniref:5-formyltetrahydrofolate cyclo-ligase n=1 Tax=Leptidea sinapis TaxID=189913 RepID=UPI0021322A28|nr:5-formyltetrahydrofolate cyclo-ligase [Leptidea sinapis]XP_050674665.1 5-formyltetrahydrofolate cyclo-ligase [Leptidea sinapis]XP_050674666.1 5-formyltetrahydrofolate cyclo-ligase [Leptidea sinapis]XP_050674667.1 5-formyltetrahydrofolate cyclo-ligase [Leptidea sinapis]
MSPRTPNPAKALIREQIAARIATLSAEEKNRQSSIVYNKVINHPHYKSANRIALFMSTDQEINTAPMIAHIKARGGAAFVPQYAGGIMRMLRLEAGDEDNMPLTRHGIAQHSKDQKREDALNDGLDLIIAPGVAFTKNGGRVGHGGGYYDKYIAHLRSKPNAPKVIAVAFNCQVLDEVPMDEFDQKIDGVIYADE